MEARLYITKVRFGPLKYLKVILNPIKSYIRVCKSFSNT